MGSKKVIDLSLVEGKRYVFFDTLQGEPSEKYQKIYEYAVSTIDKLKESLNPPAGSDNNTNRFKEALNFLKQSAAFEREKELRFFKNFETNHPEIKKLFNIDVKNILEDYIGFIANINRAIKGTESFSKIISSELKRMTDNRNDSKNISKDIKDLTKKQKEQYFRDLSEKRKTNNERFFLTANGETIFNSIFSERSKGMNELSYLIIEKYGSQLFMWKNSTGLELNGRQLNALIAALDMKANEIFLSQIKTVNPTIKLEEQAVSIINTPEFERYVQDLLNSPNLEEALTSIANQYGLSTNTGERLQKNTQLIKKLKEKLRNTYDNLKKEGKIDTKILSYEQWLNSIGINDAKLKSMYNSLQTISTQIYYVGEDISMIDLITNKISAVLGGGANPTDDIEAGALITNLNFNTNELTKLENKLWKEQATHFKQVTATSTLSDFQHNTQELLNARTEQENLIREFLKDIDDGKKTMNEFLKHVNIHSTVKGYQSAGSAAFEQYGGFGGAAFGSDLIEELGILSSVSNAAGIAFSETDKEDFLMAMINAGALMIGKELKHTIENYFSVFVGLLMFNDAEIAASDIKKWIDSNMESSKSTLVEDLHLYQLNGVVVPSSYILEATYQALEPIAAQIQNKIRLKNQGLHVKLHTYNKGPINHDWDYTAATAISQTKLERMHFLAGFYDLIDQLEQRMQNIGT